MGQERPLRARRDSVDSLRSRGIGTAPRHGVRESRSPAAGSSRLRCVPRARQPGWVSGTLAVERLRLRVRGVVQGVGFRPFVHRLAHRHGISGFVLNDADGVVVEAEGEPGALAAFVSAITAEAPPLARVAERRRDRVHARASSRGSRSCSAEDGRPGADDAHRHRTPRRATTACASSSTRPTAATATRSSTARTAARASRS